MPLYTKLFTVFISLLFFIIFIYMLRKRPIKPFFSILWLFISLLMFSVIIFEKIYKYIATKLGLADASFLIFSGVILFLLIYVLYLTIKISTISDITQELISYTSILENKIKDIKNKYYEK